MIDGALLVVGASGHGKVVADIAESCGWSEIRFYDDRHAELAERGYPWPVVGDTESFFAEAGDAAGVVVAVGSAAVRRKLIERLRRQGRPPITLVHPSAVVSRYARLGEGSVVMPGAVVNADTDVGLGAIINTGATVDHDCRLGDFVHVCPGAHLAADVHCGDEVWFGVGCAVRQGIRIGSRVVIGAGAAVVSDLGDDCTVTGVPAK